MKAIRVLLRLGTTEAILARLAVSQPATSPHPTLADTGTSTRILLQRMCSLTHFTYNMHAYPNHYLVLDTHGHTIWAPLRTRSRQHSIGTTAEDPSSPQPAATRRNRNIFSVAVINCMNREEMSPLLENRAYYAMPLNPLWPFISSLR